MTHAHTRSGFTLIELLVVLAIIALLAALGLVVSSNRDKDKVRETATQVAIQCKDAQGRAAKKKTPVGLRFLVVPLDPASKPEKTDVQWVTELQLVELPEPLIPNPKPLSPSPQNPTANPDFEPRVRFLYEVADGTNRDRFGRPAMPDPPFPAGTVTFRRCLIENLTAAQAAQVEVGCTLVLPVFGSWHRIVKIDATTNDTPTKPNPHEATPAGSNRWTKEVQLEWFPDALMGGSTHMLSHHFVVHLLATPLVGEKPIPLATNICVDLNLSVGGPTPFTLVPTSFDVMFGPDGKLVNSPSGQVFLWIRDYTKPTFYTINTGPTAKTRVDDTGAAFTAKQQRGGEQHILSIRGNGAAGHADVLWPDGTGRDFYWLARREHNQD